MSRIVFLIFAAASVACGQGHPPQQAAAKMTVPEGFTARLVASEGDKPGTDGYDDAVSLLDDAFADGYNTARKFSQTTTAFKLPTPGEKKD